MKRNEKAISRLIVTLALLVGSFAAVVSFAVKQNNLGTGITGDKNAVIVDYTGRVTNCAELATAIGEKYQCSPVLVITEQPNLGVAEKFQFAVAEMAKYTEKSYVMVYFTPDATAEFGMICIRDANNGVQVYSDDKWVTKFSRVMANESASTKAIAKAIDSAIGYVYENLVFDYVAGPVKVFAAMFAFIAFVVVFLVMLLIGKVASVYYFRHENQKYCRALRTSSVNSLLWRD